MDGPRLQGGGHSAGFEFKLPHGRGNGSKGDFAQDPEGELESRL
jgi:hypothetical protein